MLKTMTNISHISIPEPCHQEWNQMTESHNGRFCGSCSKTVVDFTTMTNEQIIAHLSAANHKTCGRFNQVQVSGLNHRLYTDDLPSAGWWKRMVLAVTMLSAVQYVKAQTAPAKPDTEQAPGSFMLGKVVKSDVANYRTITGIITDANDKLPLPGVTIKVQGLSVSTQTNTEGRFTLNIPESATQLAVSFIGYDMQVVPISSRPDHQYNLALKSQVAMLGEVVIIKKASFVKRAYYRFVYRPQHKVHSRLKKMFAQI